MLNIPTKILDPYRDFLQQQKVAAKEIPFFLKWLRFYLDFCHKEVRIGSLLYCKLNKNNKKMILRMVIYFFLTP